MKLISTDEAAEKLGVSGRRVRQLIDEGKLIAQYVGGGYVIDESTLDAVKVYGKPGRPSKSSPDASKAAAQPSNGSNAALTATAKAKKRGK